MNDPSGILIFGLDATLLQTRRWVLERQGYQVFSVGSVSDFDLIPAGSPIKLLILCHSLEHEVCDEAMQSAELRWPGVENLLLSITAVKAYMGRRAYSANGVDSPAMFVNSVKLLVGEPAFAPQIY